MLILIPIVSLVLQAFVVVVVVVFFFFSFELLIKLFFTIVFPLLVEFQVPLIYAKVW